MCAGASKFMALNKTDKRLGGLQFDVSGAVFKGRNTNGGKTWTTKCTVTHAEPGRIFAFDVKSAIIPVAHAFITVRVTRRVILAQPLL